jgi:hypothetical protein
MAALGPSRRDEGCGQRQLATKLTLAHTAPRPFGARKGATFRSLADAWADTTLSNPGRAIVGLEVREGFLFSGRHGMMPP